MAEQPRFLGLKLQGNSEREIVRIINNILQGNINSTFELTLDTGTASTSVSNFTVGGESYIQFMPLSSAAAQELYSGSMYVSNTDDKTFTVEHGTSTASDRTFRYVVLG